MYDSIIGNNLLIKLDYQNSVVLCMNLITNTKKKGHTIKLKLGERLFASFLNSVFYLFKVPTCMNCPHLIFGNKR